MIPWKAALLHLARAGISVLSMSVCADPALRGPPSLAPSEHELVGHPLFPFLNTCAPLCRPRRVARLLRPHHQRPHPTDWTEGSVAAALQVRIGLLLVSAPIALLAGAPACVAVCKLFALLNLPSPLPTASHREAELKGVLPAGVEMLNLEVGADWVQQPQTAANFVRRFSCPALRVHAHSRACSLRSTPASDACPPARTPACPCSACGRGRRRRSPGLHALRGGGTAARPLASRCRRCSRGKSARCTCR